MALPLQFFYHKLRVFVQLHPYRIIFLIAPVLGVFGLGFYLHSVLADLPAVHAAEQVRPPESTMILDRNGAGLFAAYNNQDRKVVPLHAIPPHVRDAFLAIEDERFYKRDFCVDIRALGRAAVANMSDFKSQGASTITQQLARTMFLDRSKVFRRKIRELVLACRLEKHHSKDEILHLYLNWISFGNNVYGVQQASQYFFGKDIQDISTAEAAVLAALPQRPTYFSPYGPNVRTQITNTGALSVNDPLSNEHLRIGLLGTGVTVQGMRRIVGGRAHQVVASMQRLNYITPEQARRVNAELLTMEFTRHSRAPVAPHFVLTSVQQLENDDSVPLGTIQGKGYVIETTINTRLQHKLQDIVNEHSAKAQEKHGARHMAAILVDRQSREVLAYVGNVDYFSGGTGSKVDMARAPRQPGSSFKPILYAYAMEKLQWQPYTTMNDAPLEIHGFKPQNYDGKYYYRIPLIKALNHSRNIPAIRTYEELKDEAGLLSFAHSLGLKTPLQQHRQLEQSRGEHSYGWPMAIGTAEASLYEMVEAYATLANNGLHAPLRSVRSVRDRNGNVVYASSGASTQAVPEQVAQNITSMLSEINSRPGGYWRTQTDIRHVDEAVKTGTSNVCVKRKGKNCVERKARDVWSLGYTPQYVMGVWVGNADGTPLHNNATGLTVAVPAWHEFLTYAHAQTKDDRIAFSGGNQPYYRQNPPANPENTTATNIEEQPTWIGAAGL